MSRWHSRGYLPHWEAGEFPQTITFRLAGSLPSAVLAQWQEELNGMLDDKALLERRRRIERALDRGHGEPLLSNLKIADLVENALLHFDGQRYRLHAWSIMPNHVHVVATPIGENTLSEITHSWKSFTATAANRLLQRRGAFWAPEYFDRVVRDHQHYAGAVNYVEMNPVEAGLCRRLAAFERMARQEVGLTLGVRASSPARLSRKCAVPKEKGRAGSPRSQVGSTAYA